MNVGLTSGAEGAAIKQEEHTRPLCLGRFSGSIKATTLDRILLNFYSARALETFNLLYALIKKTTSSAFSLTPMAHRNAKA